MAEKFKIRGGETLKGEVSIGGAKNSVLKLLAAAILVKGCTKIYNVPELTDVAIMLNVLSDLGAKLDYNKEEKSVVIDATESFFFATPKEEQYYEERSKRRSF